MNTYGQSDRVDTFLQSDCINSFAIYSRHFCNEWQCIYSYLFTVKDVEKGRSTQYRAHRPALRYSGDIFSLQVSLWFSYQLCGFEYLRQRSELLQVTVKRNSRRLDSSITGKPIQAVMVDTKTCVKRCEHTQEIRAFIHWSILFI